ncbi:MBL fold metallo-hydrolase [Desulfosporosinus sp. PR]|uniref:MBL fold metallo-hydrolase n=1 Tax=Candidatus Desulfosporosinus nitrosoreducens TaxID=3401928 RepID=UPI0027F7FB8A|nr:MBL fold metallo-hydrolase [Desulfosporosinus sp. PR]MDQ7095366.1 MBL fold metallo-hydrolase [Desulfosporosinus sp. PR]
MLNERKANQVSRKLIKPKLIPTPHQWSDHNVTVAWLGHASFLLNFFGTRILIDPALNSHIGITPIGNLTIGPSRYIESALKFSQVGPLDLILVSHAHTDHFDYPTLRKLQSAHTIAVTAKNTLPLWNGMKFQTVEELHWQESKSWAGVTVRAIEGRHWGARIPWKKGMEANSLLLSKNGINLFFGADTGYTELIRQQLSGITIDLAIMGIGAYSPKSFESKHATPEQAWKMGEEISAKWIIPMHWGTFKLSQEPMDEPIVRFRQAASGHLEKIALQEIGATWILPR